MTRPGAVWFAVIGILMSVLAYVGLGALFIWVGTWPEMAGDAELKILFPVGACCIALGLAVVVPALGLLAGKRWAFYVSLVLLLMYVPSAFILFGLFGLYGLLRRDTRRYFGALEDMQLF